MRDPDPPETSTELTRLREVNEALARENAELREELERERQRFDRLFQDMPIAGYIARFDDATVSLAQVNEATQILTHSRINQYVGVDVSAYGEQTGMLAHGRMARETGQTIRRLHSYPLITTGEHKHLEVTFIPVAPSEVIALAVDMTDQVLTRQELDFSKEQFRLLAENVPEAIYLCQPDQELSLLYVNDHIEHLTGHPKQAFLKGAQTIDELILDEDVGEVKRVLAQSVEQGAPFKLEYRLRRSDGEIRWVEEHGSPILGPQGDILYLEGVLIDVTERHRAEAALRDIKRRYELASQAGRVGVWDYDRKERRLYLDPILKAMLGFDPVEMRDDLDDWMARIDPRDRENVNKAMLDHLAGKTEEFHFEHRMRRRDDSIIWLLVRGRALRDENGEAVRLVGTNSDVTAIKEVQHALQRNEERYKSLFEDSPISLWEEDLTRLKDFFDELKAQGVEDFRRYFGEHPEALGECASRIVIRDVNRATVELLEAKSKQDLLANLAQVFTEESFAVFREEMIILAEGGAAFSGEIPHRTMTGREIRVIVHFNVAPGHEVDLGRVIVSLQDITGRIEAEEALRRSEERLAKLVENIPVMVLALDEDGNYLFWNKECERVTGFPAERIIGNPKARELLYPNPAYRQLVHSQARGIGLGYRDWEISMATAEGDRRVVSWTSITDQCPVPGWSIWETGLDVTERKKVEQALRESETKYRELLLTASDGIYLADWNSGRIMEVNPRLEAILGLPTRELVGRHLAEFGLCEGPVLSRKEPESLSFRPPAEGEVELPTAQGERRFVEIALSRVAIAGRLILQGRLRDVAEQQRIREYLTQARDAAEAASAAKTQFLANLSHDLRTPITTILGMNELLDRSALAPEQRRCLEVNRQASEALMRLINDLLDLSKVEAGLFELNPRPFDPREIMAQLRSMFERQAQDKGLRLTIQVDEDVPTRVLGDPDRLGQVLRNLVDNAVKFTIRGEVAISVRPIGPAAPWRLLFIVRDTGPGIPLDRQQDIFESFGQSEPSVQRKYGGQGLGMTIARHLVGLMGGFICLDSDPERGTLFSFTARLREPARNEAATAAEDAPGQTERPLNILLVDDLDTNREIIRLLLRDAPHSFTEASSGHEALKLFQKQRFDVVFMDLMMPDMDGLEATRAIRDYEEDAGLDPVPILAVTARALAEDARACLEAGCDGHLPRPFSRATLIEALRKYCGPSSAKTTPPPPTETAGESVDGVDPRLLPLIPKVLARLESLAQEIREALQAGNHAALTRQGHSVKGLGGSYGFKDIHATGEALEEAGRSGDDQAVEENLRELEERLLEIRRKMGIAKE